jgi:arsenite-transporting ATPase
MPAPAPAADPCAALAAVAASAGEAAPAVEGVEAAGGMADVRAGARSFLRGLRPRILLFAGKGGVGKSTCAAAVALGLAETREVLLVSTDPAGSLGDVLGQPVGGDPFRVAHGLRARQLDAAALLAAARERHRSEIRELFDRLGLDGAAAMDRAVVESFWNLAPPGADEVMALIELTDASVEDVLVVDASPTGHFLRLLEMPDLVAQWTRALLRIMAHYRTAVGLDDATARVLAFARQLRALKATLTDGAETGVFLVTLDAPLVDAETQRLRAALDATGFHTAACIVNRAQRGLTDDGARAIARGCPVFAAPERTPTPLGAAPLRAFLDSWKRVA